MAIKSRKSSRNLSSSFVMLILFFCLCTLLTSCSWTSTAGKIPAGCENSVIYKAMPYPDLAKSALLIAVSMAVKEYPTAREYIASSINELQNVLEDDQVTYLEFAGTILEYVKYWNQYYGSTLLDITNLLAEFDQAIPIDPCDIGLIKDYLKREQAYISTLK